jgi:hypothetical protein
LKGFCLVHLQLLSRNILIRSAFFVMDSNEFFPRFQSSIDWQTNGSHHAQRIIGVGDIWSRVFYYFVLHVLQTVKWSISSPKVSEFKDKASVNGEISSVLIIFKECCFLQPDYGCQSDRILSGTNKFNFGIFKAQHRCTICLKT